MQALALPPVVTREEWDRQTAPWKVLEVLDRAEGLAAWPAVLRQLLALYASPGCVVATFTTHLPALQRVSLVYTSDRFDSAAAAATADDAPGDAIEEEKWGGRTEAADQRGPPFLRRRHLRQKHVLR